MTKLAKYGLKTKSKLFNIIFFSSAKDKLKHINEILQ
tara:strand:- start:1188 stop:1298 length:111 start_codon:yes stop_codon:yes gene_type:complete